MSPLGASRRTTGLVLLVGTVVVVAIAWVVDRLQLFSQLTFAVQRTAAAMPSTTAAPQSEVAKGFPLLSLYVDFRDLYGAREGLLVHRMERGRAWERRTFVSYFDRGALTFASEAGIRIHGGKSRQHSPVQSYRLFFEPEYGADQFRPGLLFGPSTEPLKRLVVHNDLRQDKRGVWWHLVNPLAFDIAERVGCLTPQTRPARVFLNGQWQGVYVLTEHLVSRSYLKSHFGHTNFAQGSVEYQSDVWNWERAIPRLDMATVSQAVDLESFTRWVISILFCATTDPFQGLMLRDETDESTRWFIVNWDMDHSFMDLYQQAPAGRPWEHDTFRTVLHKREVRSDIVTRLLNEDPAYREYFNRLLIDTLNHRLTQGFLMERFEHYARIAKDYGVEHREYQPVLLDFLRFRAPHLRKLSREYLGAGESIRVEVSAPADVNLIVDGYQVGRSYEGWYLQDMPVRVEAATATGAAVSHWRVNGNRVMGSGSALEVRADQPMTIEAVLAPTT